MLSQERMPTHNIDKTLLDKTEFKHRAKDLGGENLKFIFSIIKAISISAATIVSFNILIDKGSPNSQMSFSDFWLRIIFWIDSSIGLIVTYNGAMLGTLFLSHIPKNKETILIFSLCTFEFLLFAILSANFFLEHKKEVLTFFSIDIINWWFLLFAIYCFLANRILINAVSNIKIDNFKGAEIREFVKQYKQTLQAEVKESLVTAIISLTAFVFTWFNCSWQLYIRFIIALTLLTCLIFALKRVFL